MKDKYLPRISILTPSFNQGKYIEENILSVLNQDYDNVEHIIIDGGSTDSTVEILKKYSHLKWVSEPDEGQSDALNKGLDMATGEIIGWINSDDYYLKDIFKCVADSFRNPSAKWILGNIAAKYEVLNIIIKVQTPSINYNLVTGSNWSVSQPGAFFRKEILLQAGKWDKNIHMCMDLDLWIRLTKISAPLMISKYFSVFRIHPAQKTTPKNELKLFKEHIYVRKKYGLRQYYFYIITRLLYKHLKSLLKRLLVNLKLIDSKYLYIPYFMSKNLSVLEKIKHFKP